MISTRSMLSMRYVICLVLTSLVANFSRHAANVICTSRYTFKVVSRILIIHMLFHDFFTILSAKFLSSSFSAVKTAL